MARELLTVERGFSYATEDRSQYESSPRLKWFIVYIVEKSGQNGNEPDEELDVYATDSRLARELAMKLIERDYDEDIVILRNGVKLA